MDFAKLFIDMITAILDKLPQESSEVSATLLGFIGVGMVGLLFRVVIRSDGARTDDPRPVVPRRNYGEEAGVDVLKKEIDDLRKILAQRSDELVEFKKNPPYNRAERIYFNVNGIANSGLVLIIGLLVWEFLTLNAHLNTHLNTIVSEIEHLPVLNAAERTQLTSLIDQFEKAFNIEISYFMGTLAIAIILSGIIVLIAKLQGGRSIQIINRAFVISLVVSIASFVVFAVFLSGTTR